MEKQIEITKEVAKKSKKKKSNTASKLRFEMIKQAAMKFASQRKAKIAAPSATKSKKVVAKKKKPKNRIGIPLRKDRQARRDAAAAAQATLSV